MTTLENLLTLLSDNPTHIGQLAPDHGLTLLEIDSLLTSDEGRSTLAAHRRVHRIQRYLLARRYMTFTLSHMIKLAELDTRPDVKLKACDHVLALTHLDPKPSPAQRPTKPQVEPSPEAINEVLSALKNLNDPPTAPPTIPPPPLSPPSPTARTVAYPNTN